MQDDVNYSTSDGVLQVSIDGGTTAKTAGGDPLDEITVDEICSGFPPPPANAYIVGCVYDFGPEGATFDPPITITLRYDEGLIPDGVAEEDLVIAYYDESEGEWVTLPSTVDTVNNEITAEVDGFTYFGVLGEAPEPTVAPTPTKEPTAAPTPTPEPDEGGGFPVYGIVLIILAVIVVAIVVYFIMRRRGQ